MTSNGIFLRLECWLKLLKNIFKAIFVISGVSALILKSFYQIPLTSWKSFRKEQQCSIWVFQPLHGIGGGGGDSTSSAAFMAVQWRLSRRRRSRRRLQWWRLDTVFLRALDAVRHSLAKRPGDTFSHLSLYIFCGAAAHLRRHRRRSRGPHSLNQQFFHACHDRGDQQISTRLINVFFRQSW